MIIVDNRPHEIPVQLIDGYHRICLGVVFAFFNVVGDRVRLLAGLDENGSLTVAECFGAFLETQPMAGLASLFLHRVVHIDLDHGLIGPETVVRRFHGDES